MIASRRVSSPIEMSPGQAPLSAGRETGLGATSRKRRSESPSRVARNLPCPMHGADH